MKMSQGQNVSSEQPDEEPPANDDSATLALESVNIPSATDATGFRGPFLGLSFGSFLNFLNLFGQLGRRSMLTWFLHKGTLLDEEVLSQFILPMVEIFAALHCHSRGGLVVISF